MNILGAFIGLLLSAGILLTGLSLAARRPVSIARRVAPYLGQARGGSTMSVRPLTQDDASTLGAIYLPVLRDFVAFIDRNGSGRLQLERRLAGAGVQISVEQFRIQQLMWVAVSTGFGLVTCLGLAASGREFAMLPALALIVISAGIGWLLKDYALSRAVRRRGESVRAHLPGVAELLALAVASGESAQAALERVGRTMKGPLAEECARACSETATGIGFLESLERMSDRLDVVAVRRFVDGIAIAVSRGTPLADVLRAQAADARADRHRALLEIAGRKEVLMLIPLVFLILPTVVLVALFPAMSALTSVTP
jgi:tight adherence protein C